MVPFHARGVESQRTLERIGCGDVACRFITLKRAITRLLSCRFHPRDCAIDFSTVRFILGADVVWVDSLIPGLVAAIAHVAREAERHMQTTSNNAATAGDGDEVPSHSLATSKCVATNAFPTILIAHQTRSRASDGLFFSLLEAAGLALTFIPREEQHPSYSDAAIRIIRITRASRDAPSRSTPPSKR